MKILIVLFLLTFASCNVLLDTSGAIKGEDKNCADIAGVPTKILFIGNDYLSQHNIPKIFKDISCSLGSKTQVYSMTVDEFRFMDHAASDDTLGLISTKLWHYVILQNHAEVSSWDETKLRSDSLPYAQELAQAVYVRHSGAKILYLQTPGHSSGDQTNCAETPFVCDFLGHTQANAEGNEIYAQETNGYVAYVGNAIKQIWEDSSSPIAAENLWESDGAHPSFAASYLAAAVLYSEVFDLSPEGAMSMENLSREETLYLQETAAQIARP